MPTWIRREGLTEAVRDARRTLEELAAHCGTAEAQAAAVRASAGLALVELEVGTREVATERDIDELGDVIFRLASLDFGPALEVTGDGSIFDGIRGCVNMLSEELEVRHHDLVRAKTMAEEAARAKSEFLSNMSHELRTPMHAIMNYTEMGLARLGDAAIDRARLQKYLGNIQISGRRLLSLINDLLDLSKLEAGKVKIVPVRHDFITTLAQSLAELDSLFKARGIASAVCCEAPDASACFDRERMMQVLANVLGNALRFATPGSAIRISVRDQPDGLVCSIHNQGEAIPESELESIFDRFVQSSKARNGAGGTGLGLAICRAIMEAHGGEIWAENASGGVTIHIAIPRAS
jgi:signal transduction histidine kinase